MTNEIDKPDHDFFADYANAVQLNRIIGDLLVFTKFGDFVAGRDKRLIKLGTRLIVHMPTLKVGWVHWEDGRPVEQLMGRITEGFKPKKRDELGYLDKTGWKTDDKGAARDPWQLTNYLVFSNPESELLYTFATNSKGGITAVGELAKAYSDHNRQTPGEYMIAELGMGSYRHPNKAYGDIRYPMFTKAGWVSREGPDALLGDDGEGNPPAAQLAAPEEPAEEEEEAASSPKATTPKPSKKQPAAPRI